MMESAETKPYKGSDLLENKYSDKEDNDNDHIINVDTEPLLHYSREEPIVEIVFAKAYVYDDLESIEIINGRIHNGKLFMISVAFIAMTGFITWLFAYLFNKL